MRNTTILIIAIILLGSCHTAKKNEKAQTVSKKDYMNAMYKTMDSVLKEAQVAIVEDSVKVIFRGANFFAVGSDQLMPETSDLFNRFATVLNTYKSTHVLILGHTDNQGQEDKNQVLSEKRAESAKIKLVEDSVSLTRLSSWGIGETQPVADNNSEEGRTLNRRIEFVILYDDPKVEN